MEAIGITNITAMRQIDDPFKYVAIIVEFTLPLNSEPGSMVLTESRISLMGYTIVSDMEPTDDWQSTERGMALKIFKPDDVDDLFERMENEPLGKRVIEKWKLTRENFTTAV